MNDIVSAIRQDCIDDVCRLVDIHGVYNEDYNQILTRPLEKDDPRNNVDLVKNVPLQEAVALGRVGMVRFLVDKGAYVWGIECNAIRRLFEKPVEMTPDAWNRYNQILDILLPLYVEHGKRNPESTPPCVLIIPLYNAICVSYSLDATRFVLEAYKKRNWFPPQYPFQYACNEGRLEIIEMMRSYGFRVDTKCIEYACGASVDLPPDDPALLHYLFLL